MGGGEVKMLDLDIRIANLITSNVNLDTRDLNHPDILNVDLDRSILHCARVTTKRTRVAYTTLFRDTVT